jgi:hypothetical protein
MPLPLELADPEGWDYIDESLTQKAAWAWVCPDCLTDAERAEMERGEREAINSLAREQEKLDERALEEEMRDG